MDVKGTLMINVEMCDVAVGLWCGEEKVSSCGGFCSRCSAGVVVGSLLPCVCLAADVDQLLCVECMLEGFESRGVAIQVAQDELGTIWLEGHISQDGLHHVICSGSCLLAVVGIGPTIEVVHQHGDLFLKLYGI